VIFEWVQRDGPVKRLYTHSEILSTGSEYFETGKRDLKKAMSDGRVDVWKERSLSA
jgi:hypothetical protein